MFFSSLSAPYPPVQFAQTNVAMRDERAHAQVAGQSHCLTILIFGLRHIRNIGVQNTLAENVK